MKEFNKAIFGTCAGCIVLAELGLIDVKIERNAYGCQLYSFVDDVLLENGDKVRGVFIRAPKIINLNDEIEILGKHNEDPVLVKQNNIMVATFHPELTKETKVHELFLGMIKEN